MAKEKYLLTQRLMELGRHNHGEIFGGSISTYFMKRYNSNAYKRQLIKDNKLDQFDDLYEDEIYSPKTYKGRTSVIRDIDIYFRKDDDVKCYLEYIYRIPGVYEITECPDSSSMYHQHVLFKHNYKLSKVIVRYTYNHSLTRKNSPRIYIPIDIITPRDSEYTTNPVYIMQELTIKQFVWNIRGFESPIPSLNCTLKTYDIVDDFLNDVCYFREETYHMRDAMRDYIELQYNKSETEYDFTCHLEYCLRTRVLVILRLLNNLCKFTVVNSPLSFEKEGECGICLSDKVTVARSIGCRYGEKLDKLYRWKTDKNNTQLYCYQCLKKYLDSLITVDETTYHRCDYKEEFARNPILTSREWKYLKENQIYLIENILVCPVGNKANFSGV